VWQEDYNLLKKPNCGNFCNGESFCPQQNAMESCSAAFAKDCLYNLRTSLQWELFYNGKSLLLLSKDWTHDLKKLVIKKFQAQVVDRQTAGTSCKTPQKYFTCLLQLTTQISKPKRSFKLPCQQMHPLMDKLKT
jgi:hypothetical protein